VTYRPPRAYRIGRNGMPEPVGYVYRGTGEDMRTAHLNAAQLAEWKPDYEHWLPEFPRGNNSPRPPREDACECGYQHGSMNCRALHRSRLEAVTAESYGSTR
jgi:hypothetical protein